MEPSSVSKRSNYYISREFQTRFIVRFCFLVALGSFATMALLYTFAANSTTVSIVGSRIKVMTTADFLFPFLAQTVIIVTVLVGGASAAVTLFMSHKIAGPLYRFKETLKELVGGNFTNQVKLRKGDELLAFSDEFNEMITVIRDKVRLAEQRLSAVQKDINAIGENNVEESKRRQFNDLKQKVVELERTFRFFRT
ncbi:MAG: methyl-accepting chemotaxis protein [Candidatus Omnitrophota bacterium]